MNYVLELNCLKVILKADCLVIKVRDHLVGIFSQPMRWIDFCLLLWRSASEEIQNVVEDELKR